MTWNEWIAGDIRWTAPIELRDRLFGPDGLPLESWLQSGQARPVKRGPHQSVFHVRLDAFDFHLKQYHVGNTRAWLRTLVRPAKARMECERAVGLACRGIATFVPLALGERDGQGDSFLLTQTLDRAVTLADFLEGTLPDTPEPRRTRLRIRLANALGRFVARMHDAGVVHHDFHAGNLLVRVDDDDRMELFLIDLHAVRLGSSLSWSARRANLVVLNRWFVLRSARSDRLRFWHAYHVSLDPNRRPLPAHPVEAREVARELEEATWTSNRAFWANRDRRCLVSNRYYRRLDGPAASGYSVRDLDAATIASLLADPDAPFRQEGARLLKDSRSSTVVELEAPVQGVSRSLVYKRFRIRAWHERWTALARRSPAIRSWVFGHGLRERWLPTARPLLVLHRRRLGLPAEGYLLAEKIEGVGDLHDFVADLRAIAPDRRQPILTRRIEAVARLVRELHRRRLAHRDLKATNVLTSRYPDRGDDPPCLASPSTTARSMGREPTNAAPACPPIPHRDAVWLIDLVGMSRRTTLPRELRVRDVARLHASFVNDPLIRLPDKLRFLRVYLQFGLRGRSEWKVWWRAIDEATRAKVARNRRSGRPLW